MSPLLKKDNGKKLSLYVKYSVISGFFALLIMLFVYLCHSNSLFIGDNTVLRMDLYHQYGPLYSELYDRITNGYSLLYSWTSGLGGGFLGNLFNYCCSPFAIIMLLFGHKNMPEAIAVMIMLKAVFASASFTYYINKSRRDPRVISVGFGLLYAFSSYFVAYSWNIMWLDAMTALPIVLLGIEYIINEKKPWIYLVALTYTMLTNYYMAYMVCIVSVLYFLYYFLGNYEITAKYKDMPVERDEKGKKIRQKRRLANSRFLKSGLIFAGVSAEAFLLAAFALLPVAICLQSSSATSSSVPDDLKIYFNFFDFIANHLPSVETTIRSSGDNVLPNVYCGLATVMLVPLYFFSDRISGRKKIVAVSMLAAFYFGFSLNFTNFFWHGFHFPNDLPYRQSFAYSFFILTLAYDALVRIEEFSRKQIVAAGLAVMVFAVFVDKVGSKNVEQVSIIFTFVFAVIYCIIGGLFSSPKYTRRSVNNLLVFAIIVEICFTNTGRYVMEQSKSAYTDDYEPYKIISELAEKEETEPFYRTELSHLRARMDPCWFGYNGVSTFSSMAYEKTANLMKALGLFGNKINSYTYNPQTAVFNSFFALKYIYDNDSLMDDDFYYKEVASEDKYTAYKYDYFLPVAFAVDGSIADWDTSSSNPFTVQNNLVSSACGIEDVLVPVTASDCTSENIKTLSTDTINSSTSFRVDKTAVSDDAKVTVMIDVEEPGEYYVFAGSTKLSSLKIRSGAMNYEYYSSSIQPLVMDAGYREAGDTIETEFNVAEDSDYASITYCAARLDEAKFTEAYNKIKAQGTISITKFDETLIEGTINVKAQDCAVYTSIPYDQSWQIFVDGEKLDWFDEAEGGEREGKAFAIGGGLLGFDIAAGEHSVIMKYTPGGIKPGAAATVAGIVILIFMLLYKFVFGKKIRARKTLKEAAAAEAEKENEAPAVIPEGTEPPPPPPYNPDGMPEGGPVYIDPPEYFAQPVNENGEAVASPAAEEAAPAEESETAEEAAPAEETAIAEETVPAEDSVPADDIPPADEAEPENNDTSVL